MHDALFVFSNDQAAFTPELVTNGGMDTDTDWTLVNSVGPGWEITDGQMIYQHEIGEQGSSGDLAYQEISLVSGRTYRISFDVVVDGGISFGNGLTVGFPNNKGTYYTGTGSYSQDLEYTGGNAYIEININNVGGVGDVAVDNVSVCDVSPAAQSTEILDLYKFGLEMGTGTPVYLNVRTRAAFLGGTSLSIQLKAHSSESFTANEGTVFQSKAFSLSELTAGAQLIRMVLPCEFDKARYCGLYFLGSGEFSAGSIDAWLDNRHVSGFNVQVMQSNI